MGCNPTMGLTCTSLLRLAFILALSIMASNAMADSNKDREECTEQLVGLATCLPYVGNQAKAPTPDCCTGLRQVLKDNKKCLCVIIKDRDDPQLGLNINVTLALGLPSVCHAPANVSQCPVLLHMEPNSPEAQVFFQVAKGSNHAARSPTSGSNEGNSVSADKRRTSTGQEKSHGCCSRNRRLGCEIAIGGLLLWYLIT